MSSTSLFICYNGLSKLLFIVGVSELKEQLKVGIPRSLAYYSFYPLWRVFLEKLGAEVVVSRATNRKILEDGIKETVNDACVPIKVYHGHVYDLVGRVDYIFIPRMVSADGKSTFCPKFLGLPDMIRYSGVELPPLIDVRYDCSGFPGSQLPFFISLARALGISNPIKIIYATVCALQKHSQYHKLLRNGLKPEEALQVVFSRKRLQDYRAEKEVAINGKVKKAVVALLGYPYAIYDPFISAGIYSKLLKLGVEVITFEQISLRVMNRFSKILPQNFFWYYSNQVCWAGLYFLERKKEIDGIIHVTAFGCGPDAMVDKTLELESKSAGVPFLGLTIDEHTGEGGVQTRLEAFVDMLWAKRMQGRAG